LPRKLFLQCPVVMLLKRYAVRRSLNVFSATITTGHWRKSCGASKIPRTSAGRSRTWASIHRRAVAAAKGRIERLWATLQDRLTSELRLRGIATSGRQTPICRIPGDFQRRFPTPPASPPRRAPSPVRSRADPQLSLSPRRRPRQHRAARRALAPSAAGARRRLLMPAGAWKSANCSMGGCRDARRPAARHAALSLAGLRPHPTYCTSADRRPTRRPPTHVGYCGRPLRSPARPRCSRTPPPPRHPGGRPSNAKRGCPIHQG